MYNDKQVLLTNIMKQPKRQGPLYHKNVHVLMQAYDRPHWRGLIIAVRMTN